MFNDIVNKVVNYDDDVFRNIPTIYKSGNLLDDLSSDPENMSRAENLMSETDVEDLSSIIKIPFQDGPALGNVRQATRYSDGTRFGVWYGSVSSSTTVYETVYHWQRRLSVIEFDDKMQKEIITYRRLFKVSVLGLMIDILGKEIKYPALVDKKDYSLTNALGSYLYAQGANGIVFRSARDTEGINIGAFKPTILSNVRPDSHMRYRWTPGSDVVTIEKTPGRLWKRVRSFF